jgi:hypothetical protein
VTERKEDKVVFDKEVVTDNPNAHMNLKLEFTGLPEDMVSETRKVFLTAWKQLEERYTEETSLFADYTPKPEDVVIEPDVFIDLTDEEEEEIEKAVSDMPEMIHDNKFFMIPDDENKELIIGTEKPGATLKISKTKVLVLAQMIQDCVQKW